MMHAWIDRSISHIPRRRLHAVAAAQVHGFVAHGWLGGRAAEAGGVATAFVHTAPREAPHQLHVAAGTAAAIDWRRCRRVDERHGMAIAAAGVAVDVEWCRLRTTCYVQTLACMFQKA